MSAVVQAPDHGLAPTARQRFLLDAARRGDPEADPLVMVIQITGAVVPQHLRAAFTDAVAASDGLRTVFRAVPGYGVPRLSVAGPRALPPAWREIDLGAGGDVRRRIDARLTRERALPFDPERGPLVRGLLFTVGDDRAWLAVVAAPLVADRASLAILYRHMAGGASDPELTHEQFVAWRHALEQGEEDAAGSSYWAGLGCEGLPGPRLCYRTAGRPPGALRAAASVARAPIDPQVARALGGCLTRPVDDVLQAVWWMVLARITGQAAFRAQWQHDCRRDYAPFAHTVGHLDGVLPVAVTVADDDTVAQVVDRVAALCAAHRGYQEMCPPGAATDPDQPPVGFALHDVAGAIERDGRCWRPADMPGPLARFELALDIGLKQGRPATAALHYDPACYTRTAMEGLLEQYLTALRALPDHLNGPVRDLPLAGPAERARCLAINPDASAPPDETLLDRLDGWVSRRPGAPAVVDGRTFLSYAQFAARVDRLARGLRARGVVEGDAVALLLPRSATQVVALWAVLRAGGAYLPIDPAWPERRRRAILRDAAPRLVLTVPQLMPEQGPGDGPEHLDVTALLDGTDTPAAVALPAAIRPDGAAYILYTSGSTGRPKGVVVEHRNLASYVAAAHDALGLAGCRNVALTSTVAADLGNTALFGALYGGGCLHVADDRTMADGAAFARFLVDHAIDCIKIVPSHLAALLDADVPTLPRTLVLGGEPTPWSLVDAIHARDPACRIHNHYGPTETTVGVMVHAVDPTARRCGPGLPLDRVLANCRIYILDHALRPVPVGARGELYIGGAQLCRGYLGIAAEDAFVAVPAVSESRLYRTGDLARHLPDGGVQIVGRRDGQVKIRGLRVELGEVEAALLALPGIDQAAARTWGEGDGLRLVAYVVATPQAPGCDEETIRDQLRAVLADAMVPARVLVVPALPRMANGKIDRSALPRPDADRPRAHVAPRDGLEAVLAGLVAELLGRDRVSVDDSFFDLGGHSLQVIKLVARLRKSLQVEAQPSVVFDHPSVAALARALRAGEAEPGRLDRIAELRQRVAAMSDEERQTVLRGSGHSPAPAT